MTIIIADIDRLIQSTPAGATTEFNVTWPVFEDPDTGDLDLKVFVDGVEKIVTTDWTWAGVAAPGLTNVYSGGVITLLVATSGVPVTIYSQRDAYRTADFIDGAGLDYNILDQIFNKLVVAQRDMAMQIRSCIKMPLFEDQSGGVVDRVLPISVVNERRVVLIDNGVATIGETEFQDPGADAAASAAAALVSELAAAASAVAAAASAAAAAGSVLWSAAETGAADAYVVAPASPPGAYAEGQTLVFFAGNANTGASTLTVTPLGTVAIQKDGAALTGGEIGAGDLVIAVNDGTNFQLGNNPRFNVFNSLKVGAFDVLTQDWGSLTAFDATQFDPTVDGVMVWDNSASLFKKVPFQHFGSTLVNMAASATLGFAHANICVNWTKATAGSITIPPNATTPFKTGTVIPLYQDGAGQFTVVPGAGVTLRAPNGTKSKQQFSNAALRKMKVNTWTLFGDVAT